MNDRDGNAADRGGEDSLLDTVIDGRFRIDSLLGSGSMGRVYRAEQVSIGRDVAIKVLDASFGFEVDYRERFFREAQVISSFTHPNLVRLIDFGEIEAADSYYIVMELIEGVELSALTERGRLDPAFATEVVYQTAAALIEAHDAEVIHRDLKTDNILLMPLSNGSMQVKVLDFGVAFPLETDQRLTQAGFALGTPAYMSPEQAEGEPGTFVSDLYSLGIIYFYLLTGTLPIEGDSKLSTLRKHLRPERPRPSDVVDASFPLPIESLILQMIAKEPAQRPASGRAVRREIERIREELGWRRVKVDPGRPLAEVFLPFLEVEEGRVVDLESTTDRAEALVTVMQETEPGADSEGEGTELGPEEEWEGPPPTEETVRNSTPAPGSPGSNPGARASHRSSGGAAIVEDAVVDEQRGAGSAAHPMRSSASEVSTGGTVATMIDNLSWKSAIEEEETDGSAERIVLVLLGVLFISIGALAITIIYFKFWDGPRGGDVETPIPIEAESESEADDRPLPSAAGSDRAHSSDAGAKTDDTGESDAESTEDIGEPSADAGEGAPDATRPTEGVAASERDETEVVSGEGGAGEPSGEGGSSESGRAGAGGEREGGAPSAPKESARGGRGERVGRPDGTGEAAGTGEESESSESEEFDVEKQLMDRWESGESGGDGETAEQEGESNDDAEIDESLDWLEGE